MQKGSDESNSGEWNEFTCTHPVFLHHHGPPCPSAPYRPPLFNHFSTPLQHYDSPVQFHPTSPPSSSSTQGRWVTCGYKEMLMWSDPSPLYWGVQKAQEGKGLRERGSCNLERSLDCLSEICIAIMGLRVSIGPLSCFGLISEILHMDIFSFELRLRHFFL